jgi:hypothetical protein
MLFICRVIAFLFLFYLNINSVMQLQFPEIIFVVSGIYCGRNWYFEFLYWFLYFKHWMESEEILPFNSA